MMDTLSAFARGLAAKGSPRRIFDWGEELRIVLEYEDGTTETWPLSYCKLVPPTPTTKMPQP